MKRNVGVYEVPLNGFVQRKGGGKPFEKASINGNKKELQKTGEITLLIKLCGWKRKRQSKGNPKKWNHMSYTASPRGGGKKEQARNEVNNAARSLVIKRWD